MSPIIKNKPSSVLKLNYILFKLQVRDVINLSNKWQKYVSLFQASNKKQYLLEFIIGTIVACAFCLWLELQLSKSLLKLNLIVSTGFKDTYNFFQKLMLSVPAQLWIF